MDSHSEDWVTYLWRRLFRGLINTVERFWSKASTYNSVSDCWIWNGTRLPSGYGIFHGPGKAVLAHRFAWEDIMGPIPLGMDLLHKCDNPSCVNVKHLYPGNPYDNMSDRVLKGRWRNEDGTFKESL